MPHRIRVEPLAAGWAVRLGEVANPQVFNSGAAAERAAMALGARLAGAGSRTEVVIILRDGSVAGRFVCPAVA